MVSPGRCAGRLEDIIDSSAAERAARRWSSAASFSIAASLTIAPRAAEMSPSSAFICSDICSRVEREDPSAVRPRRDKSDLREAILELYEDLRAKGMNCEEESYQCGGQRSARWHLHDCHKIVAKSRVVVGRHDPELAAAQVGPRHQELGHGPAGWKAYTGTENCHGKWRQRVLGLSRSGRRVLDCTDGGGRCGDLLGTQTPGQTVLVQRVYRSP